jgi:UDP-N-acetyl-D-glucosamine dehydrogenase
MSTCTNATSLFSELKTRIETRQARIGVVGLGYVGLPLALLYKEAKFRVTCLLLMRHRFSVLVSRPTRG